ncbi:class I SAM-dependent methyltransferase [Methylocapsa aurea]|uniref:class I SAM-dependent methyltransferase n=1 Tax=Methylocapsa aurea TaxID=663610 RepID=UPI000567AB56|nr:class I SAM-dependent methyltransferase [Methylocapsa aurea]
MNALATIIRDMIVEDGPISLERYMALALGHPAHGYYRTKTPLGASGDFITAPEISQMFGELIGLWCVEVWRLMGEPKSLHLVELGPGRGTLMADLLRAARVEPRFRSAIDLHLVETSAPLRRSQRQAIEGCGIPASWHESIEEAPSGAVIVIANEFFDALPVRHYVHQDGGWRERQVGLDAQGRLSFGLAPEPEPGLSAPGAHGEILEVGLAASHLMLTLATRIAEQGGALLAIDYGYCEPSRGETLQAVRRHGFADPLHDPGEADLTAHVDFCSLERAARAAGAQVHGPAPQGQWLARLGIFERAAMLRSHADQSQCAAIDAALERLAGTPGADSATDMARLFKVLAVTPPDFPAPPGFEMESP